MMAGERRFRATTAMLGAVMLLSSACQSAAAIPPTAVPTVISSSTSTSVPTAVTATPAPSATANLTPSATSALVAALTLTPNQTTAATSAPFIPQAGSAPPLSLTLPSNWHSTYTRLPVVDQVGEALVNVAAYAGPVSGETSTPGTGFIYIIWNYPSLAPANPAALPTSVADLQRQQILGDAYRLLRGTVFDVSCTFGTYGHSDFRIGALPAVGQSFQTTACADQSPDVVGWYAGLSQGGAPYLFYAYIQPVSDFNLGQPDLQHILDSVLFSAAAATPGSRPTVIASPTVPPTGTAVLN